MSLFSFLLGGVIGGLAVYFFQQTQGQQQSWQSTQASREGFTPDDSEIRDLTAQLQQKEAELKAKTEELQRVSEQLTSAKSEISSLREQVAATEGQAEAETKTAAPVAAPVKEDVPPTQADNLTKIEGIGPKTAEVLKDNNILTFSQLAQTDVSQLRAILENAGPTYKRMDPESWPEQAKLAVKGDWDALKELQAQLDGGKYVKS